MEVAIKQQPETEADRASVQRTHEGLRRHLELTQDIIVLGLCGVLFAAMAIKLVHLVELMIAGIDFSAVIGDIIFILVLVELFRLLLIYLEEHRFSISAMVEVGIVSTLREIILKGPLDIDWRQLLVLCAFILTLGVVLRYTGIRAEPPAKSNS